MFKYIYLNIYLANSFISECNGIFFVSNLFLDAPTLIYAFTSINLGEAFSKISTYFSGSVIFIPLIRVNLMVVLVFSTLRRSNDLINSSHPFFLEGLQILLNISLELAANDIYNCVG